MNHNPRNGAIESPDGDNLPEDLSLVGLSELFVLFREAHGSVHPIHETQIPGQIKVSEHARLVAEIGERFSEAAIRNTSAFDLLVYYSICETHGTSLRLVFDEADISRISNLIGNEIQERFEANIPKYLGIKYDFVDSNILTHNEKNERQLEKLTIELTEFGRITSKILRNLKALGYGFVRDIRSYRDSSVIEFDMSRGSEALVLLNPVKANEDGDSMPEDLNRVLEAFRHLIGEWSKQA